MSTRSVGAAKTTRGRGRNKAVEVLSSPQLPPPKALHQLPIQYHLVVVAVISHLSVETGGAAGAAWHGRNLLAKLSTASTVRASHRKIYPFSAPFVPERSRQNTSGSVTKTPYMHFAPPGYAVTQNQPQSLKCALFVVKSVLTMHTWLDTGISNVGASPNHNAPFIAAITSFSIYIMYTLEIASIHQCGSAAKRDY